MLCRVPRHVLAVVWGETCTDAEFFSSYLKSREKVLAGFSLELTKMLEREMEYGAFRSQVR